ncbi:MAG: GNAT family N-acetyltransferase [Bacteroidia bacterium]
MVVTLCIPDTKDFELIKNYISEFELDDRDLKKEQFMIAKSAEEILAFCRIRKHNGCDEMCSLGVINAERGKGYAKLLLQELIKTSTQPLYLACIIPEMFIPLGFKTVSDYPPELEDKLNYCTSELVVPEEYVIMKYSVSILTT